MSWNNYRNKDIREERTFLSFPERNLLRDVLNRNGFSATETEEAMLLDLIKQSDLLKESDFIRPAMQFAV